VLSLPAADPAVGAALQHLTAQLRAHFLFAPLSERERQRVLREFELCAFAVGDSAVHGPAAPREDTGAGAGAGAAQAPAHFCVVERGLVAVASGSAGAAAAKAAAAEVPFAGPPEAAGGQAAAGGRTSLLLRRGDCFNEGSIIFASVTPSTALVLPPPLGGAADLANAGGRRQSQSGSPSGARSRSGSLTQDQDEVMDSTAAAAGTLAATTMSLLSSASPACASASSSASAFPASASTPPVGQPLGSPSRSPDALSAVPAAAAELTPSSSAEALRVFQSAPCLVWRLSRKAYRRSVASAASDALSEIYEALLSVPLLSALSPSQIAHLSLAVKEETRSRGEQIIRKGTPGDVLYFVLQGALLCTDIGSAEGRGSRAATSTAAASTAADGDSTVSDADEGALANVQLGPGSCCGERSVLLGEPRSANVYVCSDSALLLSLEKSAMTHLLGPLQPMLDLNMAVSSLKSVREVSQRLSEPQIVFLAQRCCRITAEEVGEQIGVVGTGSQFPPALYAVLEGAIEVRDGRSGASLATLYPGDIFGQDIFFHTIAAASAMLAPPEDGASEPAYQLLAATEKVTCICLLRSEVPPFIAQRLFLRIGGGAGQASVPASAFAAGDAKPRASSPIFPHSAAVDSITSGMQAMRIPPSQHVGGAAAAPCAGSAALAITAGASVGSDRGSKQRPSRPSSCREGEPVSTGTFDFSSLEGINAISSHLEHFEMDELDRIATLGVGTFGKVLLVKRRKTGHLYALKIVRKSTTIKLAQQNNVALERAMLSAIRHPFLLHLFNTFQDSRCLYMLTEFIQGGDLFALLDQLVTLPQHHARFYGACVLEALSHLHSLGFIYRDLKPENLLIDRQGYIRVVDFGLSRYTGVNERAFTLCGTAAYMSPEMIAGKGYSFTVDYWALGTLLFEMLYGFAPFETEDQLTTVRNILKANVEFPNEPQDEEEEAAQDLIVRLLSKDVVNRIGCRMAGADEVREHMWLRDVDFPALLEKRLPAPWVPELEDENDTHYFLEFADTGVDSGTDSGDSGAEDGDAEEEEEQVADDAPLNHTSDDSGDEDEDECEDGLAPLRSAAMPGKPSIAVDIPAHGHTPAISPLPGARAMHHIPASAKNPDGSEPTASAVQRQNKLAYFDDWFAAF
jgi:serine/threonine protein kinase/CRP-like cAMP-binding protein